MLDSEKNKTTVISSEIDALNLSYAEKLGLQLYKNYNTAFTEKRDSEIIEEINAIEFDFSDLERFTHAYEKEPLSVSIILACSFADECLLRLIKSVSPKDVIGRKADIFGSYGPFSSLSRKITLTHYFGIATPDMLEGLDKLRNIRNKLSHNWDISKISETALDIDPATHFPIDEMLANRPNWFQGARIPLTKEKVFRIKTIWLICMLYYQSKYNALILNKGVRKFQIIFEGSPKPLVAISSIAIESSSRIVKNE